MPTMNRLWMRRAFELAAMIALTFFFVGAVVWLSSQAGIALPQMPLLRHTYLYFLLTALLLAYFYWRGEPLAEFGIVAPRRFLVLFGRGFLIFVAILIFEIAITPFIDPVILKLTGAQPHQAERFFAALRGNLGLLLYLIPVGWVFGGIGEEILNRGFIMTRMAQVLGNGRVAWVAAVVLQGMLFGIGHAYQGPVGIFGVFVIGMLYAVGSLAWGRNLWPAIVAHALFDTFGFWALYSGFAQS
ncbi:MAG: CPBP family intramembrane metalloprotease [Proteobacteria bacterium]|nr:CPBP family intramembrane metalloprotease [Pseudomonadota bacterium]